MTSDLRSPKMHNIPCFEDKEVGGVGVCLSRGYILVRNDQSRIVCLEKQLAGIRNCLCWRMQDAPGEPMRIDSRSAHDIKLLGSILSQRTHQRPSQALLAGGIDVVFPVKYQRAEYVASTPLRYVTHFLPSLNLGEIRWKLLVDLIQAENK